MVFRLKAKSFILKQLAILDTFLLLFLSSSVDLPHVLSFRNKCHHRIVVRVSDVSRQKFQGSIPNVCGLQAF